MRDWILIVLLSMQLFVMIMILFMQFRVMDKVIEIIPKEITFNYTDDRPETFKTMGGK